jgi:hypothetical protein
MARGQIRKWNMPITDVAFPYFQSNFSVLLSTSWNFMLLFAVSILSSLSSPYLIFHCEFIEDRS